MIICICSIATSCPIQMSVSKHRIINLITSLIRWNWLETPIYNTMGTVNGCIFFIFQLSATYSDTGQILKNVIFSHDRASVIQLCTLHYTLIFSPVKLKPSEMIKLICKCFQSKDLLLALIFYVFSLRLLVWSKMSK